MPSLDSPAGVVPRIAVLLATHNGRRWLPEQVESILSQEGVDLRLIALDDVSSDGTREWLEELAGQDDRVILLPDMGPSGGSAPNFYRLLRHADYDERDLIAFADQDDVWMPGKLARHARLLREGGFDGVSSDVTSFTPDGKRDRVRKAFPQRKFDYLLESPGPGSTFLITHRLAVLTRDLVSVEDGPAAKVEFHDSLIYVVARAHGWTWHIDPEPSVDYRQHATNVMGANIGIRSALGRLKLIREGWLRGHAQLLARVALAVSSAESRPEFEELLRLFASRDLRSRWALARRAPELRRRRRDQAIIGLSTAIGIW